MRHDCSGAGNVDIVMGSRQIAALGLSAEQSCSVHIDVQQRPSCGPSCKDSNCPASRFVLTVHLKLHPELHPNCNNMR